MVKMDRIEQNDRNGLRTQATIPSSNRLGPRLPEPQSDCVAGSASSQQRHLHTLISTSVAIDNQARVQALRELKRLLSVNHQSIDHLPPSTPITLSKSISSFPITSRLASQSLLLILNQSSAGILAPQFQPIINSILLAFSSLIQRSRSSPSKDLLVSITYLFRLLSAMLVKVGPRALINLSDQIDFIQHCYRPIPLAPNPSRPTERILLGSHHQPYQNLTSSAPRLHKQNSDSETSSDTEPSLWPLNTDPQAIQCRLDALNYLKMIAESDPKALYGFWPRLLPTCETNNQQLHSLLSVIEYDSQLVVRLRACNVVKKMLAGSEVHMAIAEDNNSRISYISLSAQIASMTKELHRRFGRLLIGPSIAFELTKQLLEICETLTKVSAYHRISVPILELIIDPIRSLLTSSDFAINQQARKTLIVVLQNLKLGSQPTISKFADLVGQIALVGCHRLGDDPSEPSVSLWCELIQSTLPFLVWNEHLTKEILKLLMVLEPIPSNQEEARSKLFLLGSLCMFFPGSEFDPTFIRWIRARLRSDGLDSLDVVVNGNCERILKYVVDNLNLDLQNVWDDVRAIRLIGIIISKRCISNPEDLVPKVALHLLNYYENLSANDESANKVISTHTWVMANCLEVIKDFDSWQELDSPFDLEFWLKALKTIQHLLTTGGQSNSLKTNSVRIMGVAVCQILRMRQPELGEAGNILDSAISEIIGFLDVSLPKVQWNAATALRAILSALVDQPTESNCRSREWKDRISSKLCNILSSNDSFKVRIQVCLALQVVRYDLSAQAVELISRIRRNLEDQFHHRQIPEKEIAHGHRLRLEIGLLLSSPLNP